MKKTFMWILALGMSFTLVACSRNKEQKEVAAAEAGGTGGGVID
jgi:hypothetical protein